jgi:hypothetical protein
MPFDPATLAVRLAATEPDGDDRDLDVVLARQLIRQELDHEANSVVSAGVLAGFQQGLQVAEIRLALRGSYERLVDDHSVAGEISESFRRLTAYASVHEVAASSEEIAQCIGAYRLVLGREPDPQGFATFVTQSRTHSLGAAINGLVVSGEAAKRFAPEPPPTVATLLLDVVVVAGQVLHAVASDTSLGSILNLADQVDALAKRLKNMERKLDRFMEVVLLRLDAQALSR